MPETALTPPHSPQHIKHIWCSQCQRPMSLVRSEYLGLRYDIRTFECAECKREEMAVVKRA